jgi:hypothetical protein
MLGPEPWPQTGEIDIMEDVNGLSKTSGTLHCGNLTDRNADGTFGPCHEKSGLGGGHEPRLPDPAERLDRRHLSRCAVPLHHP